MSVANQFGYQPQSGLLLVGHGSREAAGVSEFLAAARRVAELAGETPVEPAFLEFAQPAIADGFAALARRGARRIVVVPVLLFAAGHAKRDIPAAVADAAAEHPDVAVAWSEHLGCHEMILDLSRQRFDEAIGQAAPGDDGASPHDTVLVMVGRGSRDPEATAQMRRFVELRAAGARCKHAWVGFVAMAEPPFTAVLDEAAACGAARVVVQPHLLFGGVLVDRIAGTVADYAARHPGIEWVVAQHLGPAESVAQAILARARQGQWSSSRAGTQPLGQRR